jgi:hypothetical protein
MKGRPTAPLSVIFLIFIVHIRPYVIIICRVPRVILIRSEVAEGVVIRVLVAPPLIMPALPALLFNSVTAAACHLAPFPFPFYHPFSPHLSDPA